MIRVLGWTLLHFVWQGAAVAALLASLNVALRRATPQARYLAGCGSLLLMLALPALTFRAMSTEPSSDRGAARSVDAGAPVAAASKVVDAAAASPATTARARAAARTDAAFAPTLPTSFDLDRRIEALLPSLVMLWIAGVLLLAM